MWTVRPLILSVLGLTLLAASLSAWGERSDADPLPLPSHEVATDAHLYLELAVNRRRQIERLEAYLEAGQFPENQVFAGGSIPVFVDSRGVHCAVGYLMAQDGQAETVDFIHRLDNYVHLNMVHDGPVLDWIATSGLTKEECVLIQPSYPHDPGRPSLDPGPPGTPREEDLLLPPELVGPEEAMKRIAGIRAHLEAVVEVLRRETHRSLQVAVERLREGRRSEGSGYLVLGPCQGGHENLFTFASGSARIYRRWLLDAEGRVLHAGSWTREDRPEPFPGELEKAWLLLEWRGD